MKPSFYNLLFRYSVSAAVADGAGGITTVTDEGTNTRLTGSGSPKLMAATVGGEPTRMVFDGTPGQTLADTDLTLTPGINHFFALLRINAGSNVIRSIFSCEQVEITLADNGAVDLTLGTTILESAAAIGQWVILEFQNLAEGSLALVQTLDVTTLEAIGDSGGVDAILPQALSSIVIGSAGNPPAVFDLIEVLAYSVTQPADLRAQTLAYLQSLMVTPTASIKKRILDAIESNLETIKSPTGLRDIRQTRNIDLLETDISPCLLWAAGIEEPLMPYDSRGLAFKFPIAFKIHCKIADTAVYVAQLQTLIEADPQLGGLCVDIEGGEETPFLNTADTSEGGSFVVYEFAYRRRRGDPSTGY